MPIVKNKNIFITGYPGSGKTTLFNEIINGIKKIKPDIVIYGFITKEIEGIVQKEKNIKSRLSD
jgi:nucleoside-triphosphatase THEP1